MKYDLGGNWKITLQKGEEYEGLLPGTLDENRIGEPDRVAKPWHPDVAERNEALGDSAQKEDCILSRFTRNYIYEGPVVFSRIWEEDLPADRRVFLFAERARALTLSIDKRPVPALRGSLSTPWEFEVTGLLHKNSLLELTCDNTYPGMPSQDILFSSAATDETQTNWNGILGEFRIQTESFCRIDSLQVYPRNDHAEVRVQVSFALSAKESTMPPLQIRLTSDAFSCEAPEGLSREITWDPAVPGATVIYGNAVFTGLKLSADALSHKWDEGEGNLCSVTAFAEKPGKKSDSGNPLASRKVSFGIRDFGYDKAGRLTLNGRPFFLRGEANCGEFPETGHPPMDPENWRKILKTYASYGVNVVRFHSWCPPEAAFSAADELGMMLEPELSNWNPRTAFSTPEARSYYEKELTEILRYYGNHPSFVMLTLGNELHCDETGIDFMHRLLVLAKDTDPTRLFAWGSNNFYGTKGTDPVSDFYTSSDYTDGKPLRASGVKGRLNTEYPGCLRNFDPIMTDLRNTYQKPVFGFEVGQYEVLPDFSEFELFRGVTRPDNLIRVQRRLQEMGVSMEEWSHRIAASGELALLCYREEVEAVLRTPSMSGLSLLGLQDFPGQGTALVGMMNSHLLPKPYPFGDPDRFHAFFRDAALLLLLPKYTYSSGETLECEARILNYGKKPLTGVVTCRLLPVEQTTDSRRQPSRSLPDEPAISKTGVQGNACILADQARILPGESLSLQLRLPLAAQRATRFNLQLQVGSLRSEYPLWVYPEAAVQKPACIYETDHFDEEAAKVLSEGGTVYLTPPSTAEALPGSAKAQFSTDFWSVGTFPAQEGTMGQWIDATHPVFRDFPTEDHTNWQWFPMASQRAFVLPSYLPAIVTEMDSYATLRPMAQLLEGHCLGGRILVSSFGLQDLQQYPEARALLQSIYNYLSSEEFRPETELDPELLKKLVP